MRQSLALAAALCLVAGRGVAQDTTEVKDSGDVLILDHTFNSGSEFLRVFLQGLEVYRVEINAPAIGLELKPLKGAPPVITSQEPEGTASGRSIIMLYPKEDAEYELHLIGTETGARLLMFRDLSESKRRAKILATPSWEIGVEFAAGYHTGYLLGVGTPTHSDNDEGSWHAEGCFSARSGPGWARYLSGCAFGLGWDNRPGADGVLWFFMEPRLRFGPGRPRGVSNTEIGFLFRAGVGQMPSGGAVDPVMLAPGGYITHNVRKNMKGKGWSITLSYAHALLKNTEPNNNIERINLVLGWYQ